MRPGETARERMARVLRVALEPGEDEPIDDATRRLMLHLSIDQPPAPVRSRAPVASATTPPAETPPTSLLRRVFARKSRQHDRVSGAGNAKPRGSDGS